MARKAKATKAGQLLRAQVDEHGMKAVARQLNTSVPHLYRLLSGDRGPGLTIAGRALLAYGVPIQAWSQRGVSGHA